MNPSVRILPRYTLAEVWQRWLHIYPFDAGGTIRTIALLALFAAFQPGSTDPRIGSWTLVSAQSSIDPANKLSITPVPNGMHVVMSGEAHLDFTANTNGHQAAAPGNLGFNQIELHRGGRKSADVLEKKDGALVATVHEKLSNDGNELTSTTTAPGKAPQITVWTRTGGAKNPKDPFAGEWTQDQSKTRMKQASVLKIESDGSGGVRFLGEYSYTARFDGKSYDVKNSRNDTVALSLADPHTVDATYRRDNQVTQKDKWQVSSDGQQMTLSTTATLETGQHVTEKLVFKKQ
ncbi:hypothetical protein [Terriglobus roseus]|uniref:Uncharacterized protein n=1 Tax=Terriglobus roseus TaxID=392734 RepID=A0A1G7JDS4_9BACT|nr:hypothetical protein [Terriglobus roseus]SDF23046.1 hypothetical protein SAMN05444167_1784 [Terriglobus roseus]